MDEERLLRIEQEKQNALNNSNNVYNGLIQDNQTMYNDLNNQANSYEQIQNDILDKQLAYNTGLIEQQKEAARENKRTEEMKAKNDYTQFINPYGYRNENLAERGLANSGVSETSMLGGFNAYQNRLSAANKALQDAFVSYDNEINQARLNNDVQKAQNALNKLKMQIDFSQNYYNNKSGLMQNQLNYNQGLNDSYFNKYQTEYSNIQKEREAAEQARQWQAQFDFQKQQAAQNQRNWEQEFALSQRKAYGGGSSGSNSSVNINNGVSLDQIENDATSNSSTGSKGILGNLLDKANGYLNSGEKSANGYGIIANPNTGSINPDTKYGVFNFNDSGTGYQPNNVGGDALKNSGMKVKDIYGPTAYGASGISLANQKIWQTSNGNYYIWDGSINDYIDVTKEVKKAKKDSSSIIWNM